MLTGTLEPDSGRVKMGASLQMVSLDQRRSSLDPRATLADTLTGGKSDSVVVNGQSRHVIGYMKDFLFGPEQARTPVGVLSGGERGRLTLAVALAKPSNLLVLDEPTNDLDLETLELLQELLADYPGTVMVVSHDRDFLDRVATSVINAEGDGKWLEYAGGYSDMVAQRGRGVVSLPSSVVEMPRKRAGGQAGLPQTSGGQGPKKLSFKDKHALETLPARITKLEREIASHQKTMSDGGLYARDPAAFRRASEGLAAAQAALSAAEESWLELEALREQVEGR
jgi:ATP-binding cassette subfamily F protein uup